MRPRLTVIVAVATLATACSREQIVKVAWDRPAVAPDRYRIFVDEHLVQEIPPPPVSAACHCLTASVSVPRGPHTIQIVAYNFRGGSSPPATLTVR
jgi:hypothetical protein